MNWTAWEQKSREFYCMVLSHRTSLWPSLTSIQWRAAETVKCWPQLQFAYLSLSFKLPTRSLTVNILIYVPVKPNLKTTVLKHKALLWGGLSVVYIVPAFEYNSFTDKNVHESEVVGGIHRSRQHTSLYTAYLKDDRNQNCATQWCFCVVQGRSCSSKGGIKITQLIIQVVQMIWIKLKRTFFG